MLKQPLKKSLKEGHRILHQHKADVLLPLEKEQETRPHPRLSTCTQQSFALTEGAKMLKTTQTYSQGPGSQDLPKTEAGLSY